MSKPGNAVAARTVAAAVDPYDPTKAENRVSLQRTPSNAEAVDRAVALKSKLGAMLLGSQSEFAAIARAAKLPAETLVLELIAAARKQPAILECTEASIMTFMFDAAKLGLMIGRGVFPVPMNHGQGRDREKRLEAWIGYKGAKELAISTGAIRDCWATVVFEGDSFEFVQVPVPHMKLHVFGANEGNMKKAIGVYATLLYPGGTTRAKYFKRAKIEEYKKKNRGDTSKSDSPWVTNPEEMWQAKAILHTVGDLPQNPRTAHLNAVMARAELGAGEELPALPPGEEVQPGANTDEGLEELPPDNAAEVEAEPEPQEMSLGVATAVTVKLRGGQVRMLGELRNSALEAYLAWARKQLDGDPESSRLQEIAQGCARVLKARAAGEHREPPKPAEIGA